MTARDQQEPLVQDAIEAERVVASETEEAALATHSDLAEQPRRGVTTLSARALVGVVGLVGLALVGAALLVAQGRPAESLNLRGVAPSEALEKYSIIPHVLDMECAGHFGDKEGDKVCCGQEGTIADGHGDKICPKSHPYCHGFVQNVTWGFCSSFEDLVVTHNGATDEKKAKEKAADEKKAKEKAADEKKAKEKAADEKKAKEKAADEKKAKEKAADEKKAKEKAADEKKAKEKAADKKKNDSDDGSNNLLVLLLLLLLLLCCLVCCIVFFCFRGGKKDRTYQDWRKLLLDKSGHHLDLPFKGGSDEFDRPEEWQKELQIIRDAMTGWPYVLVLQVTTNLPESNKTATVKFNDSVVPLKDLLTARAKHVKSFLERQGINKDQVAIGSPQFNDTSGGSRLHLFARKITTGELRSALAATSGTTIDPTWKKATDEFEEVGRWNEELKAVSEAMKNWGNMRLSINMTTSEESTSGSQELLRKRGAKVQQSLAANGCADVGLNAPAFSDPAGRDQVRLVAKQ